MASAAQKEKDFQAVEVNHGDSATNEQPRLRMQNAEGAYSEFG